MQIFCNLFQISQQRRHDHRIVYRNQCVIDIVPPPGAIGQILFDITQLKTVGYLVQGLIYPGFILSLQGMLERCKMGNKVVGILIEGLF